MKSYTVFKDIMTSLAATTAIALLLFSFTMCGCLGPGSTMETPAPKIIVDDGVPFLDGDDDDDDSACVLVLDTGRVSGCVSEVNGNRECLPCAGFCVLTDPVDGRTLGCVTVEDGNRVCGPCEK